MHFHGVDGFNLWIKPVVSSQMTPNPNHVSGFAKYNGTLLRLALCSFALYDCPGLCDTGQISLLILRKTALLEDSSV